MAVGSIASEFVVSVISGGLIGWVVDALTDTKPWGLVIGFGVGLIYGFYRFVTEALALTRKNEHDRSEAGGGPGTGPDAR